MDDDELRRRLRAIQQRLGWTGVRMAERAGLFEPQWSMIMSGKRACSAGFRLSVLRAWPELLDVIAPEAVCSAHHRPDPAGQD